MENNSLEVLEKRLQEIEEEKEAILKLISIWKGQPVQTTATPKITATSYSITGRVVDATVELIHKLGKQVGNQEILDYVNEKGISLGNAKNKKAMLSALLSQEIRKKSGARLRSVARGVYDLK
jgi:hypothetical protein